MTSRYDQSEVLVMGGGVAGCACGIFLANAGFKVMILEETKHPRHHVGESLLPASMEILGRLGIGTDEMARRYQAKYGARFYDPAGDRMAVFGFTASAGAETPPPSFQVWREDFDRLLAARAREVGCEVLENAVVRREGAEEELQRPRIRLTDGRIFEGDFLVDATGRTALLAAKRHTRQMFPHYGRVAIYNYFTGVAPHDHEDARYITMYLFEGGWVWLIPLPDGRTSVGVVLADAGSVKTEAGSQKTEAVFWEAIRRMPRLVQRMSGAKPTETYRAAADFSYAVREKFGQRFVLVGDAAGFLDPIFSSGVHLALASAEKAAAGVTEMLRGGSDSQLQSYAAFVEQGYRVFAAFVERFYHGGLVDNLLFMPRKPPAIQAAMTRILAGYVWERDNPVLKLLGV